MATNTKLPPPAPSNGVITGPTKGMVGGNRKKQKRRAKQAAKQATQLPLPPGAAGHSADVDYDEDPLGYGEEEYDYSDPEQEQYQDSYLPRHNAANGVYPQMAPSGKKKNKKKQGGHAGDYDPHMLAPLPNPPPPPGDFHSGGNAHGHHQGNIWNTSTQQERQNIKDFWLSLSEDDRKALLKIEKEAVLKKMKQQQKHSCSCSVCGRKRTAIEEELEVLYEGYYEELEQYAHHDHPPLPSTDAAMPLPLQHRHSHPLATPPPPLPHHKTSHLHEHLDDEELSEDDEYGSDEVEYSDEEPELESDMSRAHPGVPDFFNFGSHLTVKDNLLTVADDLLKNDGRKFIEMMEQLAERRMQRETRSQYEAESHSGYGPDDASYSHEDPMTAGDDFDEEEDSYASGEEYDDEMEEEDEMGGLTEEQRMQEGRRMFQIFAARMFEQRVLTAYREKVAAERQRKLLEELDDEDKLQAQREAKKQRDAQKKKDKKKQQQAAKAEEKAKKDAEKAEEEARLREAEEKKMEEQRRKKEEQRKKREEEKRKLDEEKSRKEADKLRRQQEEQQRREETERKAREQKAAEKARKDEIRKREREERDAREKEVRDRKAQEDRERKEREAKASAERMAKEREKSAQQAAQPSPQAPPQITKRPSQPGMVAVPGVYPKQTAPSLSSPHPSVATPAVPKAPTPATKPRQSSRQTSHASSPNQAPSQVSSAPSKSSSPGSVGQQHVPMVPKQIMQKTHSQSAVQPPQQHPIPTTSPLNQPPMQPPPGMGHPQQHHGNFGGPPLGYQNFPGHQGPMMQGNASTRGPFPMMPPQGPPAGAPNRMSFQGMNGMPAPPSGMAQQQSRPMGYPLDAAGLNQPPPGFGQPALQQSSQTSPIGQPQGAPGSDAQRPGTISHSRQQSLTEKERLESAVNQPIARPAPIQRPSSVKPQDRQGSGADVDDLSKHLGSSALLDDTDEPIPTSMMENRRTSNAPPGSRNVTGSGLGQIGGNFGPPGGGFASPASTWNTSPFGQGPGLGQPGWNNLPAPGINSWSANNNAFGANGAFGAIGGGASHQIHSHRPAGGISRPLAIRLAICQACKQLSAAPNASGSNDGFHSVDILLRQIEVNRPPLDSAPTLREIEEICETEGDSQNGGGELHVRKSLSSNSFAVRWEANSPAPDQHHHLTGGRGPTGLGEIGSPMPGKTSPTVGGFGAPGMGRGGAGFGSLGAAIGSSAPGGS